MITTTQKHLFDLPDDVTYLNCAYMSPQLLEVERIGVQQVSRKNQPWNTSIDDFFQPVDTLKASFAQLINIAEKDRIAIVPSASYALSSAAANLKLQPTQNIIVAQEQFPSNYYPWQRVAQQSGCEIRTVALPDSLNRGQAMNEALLNAIDEHTAMVALGHIHWANGVKYDLLAIREKTRQVGALLVIDGTQSVGALPFDASVIQPDLLACAGYKWLLGPYSLGVAYFGPYFDNGVPIEENWINRKDSYNFQGLVNYDDQYRPLAGRYSMGEQSNFILSPMLRTAIEQLNAWGVDNIQQYARSINASAMESLQEMGCLVESIEDRAHHLVGVRLGSRIDGALLQTQLSERKVFVSQRGDAIRISTHVFNTAEDLEKLVSCFKNSWK
jgi:selenocysteine lyase/cysteine desulfurase